jgi:hypothetical protein
MHYKILLVIGFVLLAGCNGAISGITGPDAEDNENQRLRLAIQNEAPAAQTVGVNLTTTQGDSILNETKEIESGGGWLVTTLNLSSYEDEVIEFTITLPQQNKTLQAAPIRAEDSLERGARLYTIDQNSTDIYECKESVDCWTN